MKVLSVLSKDLQRAGRWDIDFHLPPVEIAKFQAEIVVPVSKGADIIKTKRDPTKRPEESFQYIDIASIDVETGVIARPQELTELRIGVACAELFQPFRLSRPKVRVEEIGHHLPLECLLKKLDVCALGRCFGKI